MHCNQWQLQEAKAQFSQVVKEAREHGEQFITYRGEVAVIVISKERYEELLSTQSLYDIFKNAPLPEVNLEIKRSQESAREIDL